MKTKHNIEKKLVRRVEPTKQYTKSQNKYAPETKQLKIKGVKYANDQPSYRRGIRNLKSNCHYCIRHPPITHYTKFHLNPISSYK